MGTNEVEYADKAAPDANEMALLRTKWAVERTLGAWVRTGLSMIGFGFTIYKFLQGIQEKQPVLGDRPEAPRNVGLALVIMGILAVLAASYQHVNAYRQLGLDPFRRPVSIGLMVAASIVILGVLILLGIAVRIGPF